MVLAANLAEDDVCFSGRLRMFLKKILTLTEEYKYSFANYQLLHII